MRPTNLLIALAALASSCTTMPLDQTVRQSPPCPAATSRVEAARQAFFFAFPLYETARVRQLMLSAPGAKVNKLRHRTTLSGPGDRSITMPNTDTLYSAAWLDLTDGPVRLSMPLMGSRYHSVQVLDAFSDVVAVLRNDSGSQRSLVMTGPEWDGRTKADEAVLRIPTNNAWLVVRTAVKNRRDLAEAQGLQRAFVIEPGASSRSDPAFGMRIPNRPNAEQYLTVVNAALASGPVPQIHAKRLTCFKSAGLSSGTRDAEVKLDPAMLRAWDANIALFYDEAVRALETAGSLHYGWRYPASNLAEFGTDDVDRTAIALGGLAALPVREALNPVAYVDSEGFRLTGASQYRLRIPGKVPVDGFWSLTLYESDGAGRWFLYKNPIERYSMGSASSGLERSRDGALLVDIAHTRPAHVENWLPAPEGQFLLVFRAYRPQDAFINGTFRLPPIERVNE